MNARTLILSLFLAFATCTIFAAQAETDDFMHSVKHMHIHETSFKIIDSNCNTQISLTEEKLAEINQLVLAKTGMSYQALVSQLSDPEDVKAQAEMSTQALLDSNCDPAYLEYWHMVMSESLEEHLSSFQ